MLDPIPVGKVDGSGRDSIVVVVASSPQGIQGRVTASTRHKQAKKKDFQPVHPPKHDMSRNKTRELFSDSDLRFRSNVVN